MRCALPTILLINEKAHIPNICFDGIIFFLSFSVVDDYQLLRNVMKF